MITVSMFIPVIATANGAASVVAALYDSAKVVHKFQAGDDGQMIFVIKVSVSSDDVRPESIVKHFADAKWVTDYQANRLLSFLGVTTGPIKDTYDDAYDFLIDALAGD